MDGKYSNSINRWEGIGPYYAMFPAVFAQEVINKYTKEEDIIIDPFAGRGTSIFAAATNNRKGIGIEINPVGWLYAKVKLAPAPIDKVKESLISVDCVSNNYTDKIKSLPTFFEYCYDKRVLQFLLAARDQLKWKTRGADATLMALILVNLHGKYGNALSNQMRQTKSMSPKYAVEWWKKKGINPPKIDPKDFLSKRIEWRYRHGVPSLKKSIVYLGDSPTLLSKVKNDIEADRYSRPSLLFTSPPYLGVTNYHYDQWLRLWMLGYADHPVMLTGKYQKRFIDIDDYKNLLSKVFNKSASLLKKNAIVYVRTDYRQTTYQITKSALLQAFPNKKMEEKVQPLKNPSQTRLFKKDAIGVGEIDLIMKP